MEENRDGMLLRTGGLPSVPPYEDFGEDGAGNAVPRATDGTRYNGEGIRGHKEGHGEVRAETGVLHAYLDAQRTFFGRRETAEMCYRIAQDVTQCVVTQHDGESQHKEQETALNEGIVHSGHYPTDDNGEARNGETGHQGLNVLKDRLPAQPQVEGVTNGNGDDRHNKDLAEHAHRIDLNLCACQPQHKERRENGGKERGDTRHADAERHVAMAEERHDVARHAARTAADEHNADRQRNAIRGKGRNLAEQPRQAEGYKRHDRKLRSGTDEDVARATRKQLKVLRAQREAHGEHDDANDDGLRVAFDPRKKCWKEEGDNSREYNDKTRPAADKSTYRKEYLIHCLV